MSKNFFGDQAEDACSAVLVSSISPLNFTCADIGNQIVTVIFVDASGNELEANIAIEIKDVTSPVATTKSATIYLDATGNVVLAPADVDDGSSDNCSIASMELDKTSFDCSNIGSNTVKLMLKDASGNEASAEATVTVKDDIAPTVITRNVVINLDANGQASIAPIDVDAGSTDNCGIASMELDITSFDCSNIGPNTVTLTVKDVNDNLASKTAIVEVRDRRKPVISSVTASPYILLHANHKMIEILVTINSTDNCGISTCEIVSVKSNEPEAGTDKEDIPGDMVITGKNTVDLRAERSEDGDGRVYTIRVKCMDPSGNTSFATTEVVVPKNNRKLKIATAPALSLVVINNPSNKGTAFKLQVKSPDKVAPVQLTVYDAMGRPVERVAKMQPGATTQVGAFYLPGMYFAEATQNDKKVMVKLIKQ